MNILHIIPVVILGHFKAFMYNTKYLKSLMEDKFSIKKENKKEWIKPNLEVINLSQTQTGGKVSVPGEPNPLGFGLYGS